MASTGQPMGDVPWRVRWWRARWPAAVVTTAALVGVVVLIAGPLASDGAKDVQGLTGATFTEVDGLAAPDGVERFTNWDFLLMVLVTIGLVGLMSLRSLDGLPTQLRRARRGWRTWWPIRRMPSSVRWKLVGGAAAVVYLLADVVETLLLRHVLTTDVVDGTLAPSDADVLWFDDQIHAMAWLHNVKWLSLAVAILVTVSLLGRRTPTRPGADRDQHGVPCDWHGPDHRPVPVEGGAPDWEPTVGRLGVSVSGGGIRSASFALGAFDVLRREGLLARARYVCSVSGGTYATTALEHANRTGEAPAVALHRLRRRLHYLMTDTARTLASLTRVIFGLLLNLVVLYLVIFVVVRPVGWLIGSPLFQEGLRYDGPVAVDVVGGDDDPDGLDTWESPDACALPERPDERPGLTLAPSADAAVRPVPVGDGDVTRVEFAVTAPTQCVEIDPDDDTSVVTSSSDQGRRYWHVDLVPTTTGVLRIENGVASIVRQPELGTSPFRLPASTTTMDPTTSAPEAAPESLPWIRAVVRTVADGLFDLSDLVTVELPDLEVSDVAGVATVPTTDAELTELFEPPEPVSVTPVNPLDLRTGIDLDDRHVWIPVGFAVAAVVAYALTAMGWVVARRTNVPRGWGRIYQLPTPLTVLAAAALALFVVLPWLADVFPKLFFAGAAGGPSDALAANVPWLPAGLSPIVAWPILAVATVVQFKRQLGAVPKPESRQRNTVALLSKIGWFVTKVVVGLVLVVLFVGTAIGLIATGAMNGPFGTGGWTSDGIPILGWGRSTQELLLWVAVGIGLLVTRTVFQANSWSLAPIYRNGLRWAFMDDDVEHGALDGRTERHADGAAARAGHLADTDAELVICCAANIVGPDRAPAGRNAVSFTASRSWIGGPELGWMRTGDYLDRLAPARAADLSIPSMVAISGAAASPAMGKQSLGPIGSILAILNVRLGGWLPHPQAVRNMGDDLDAWKHTPGWTYFVREVLRRHRHESSYVYVSDGGHWENLGIVESLRRGCDHVIAVSAAGDGVYSHGTLAEAIEIARTDLDIDIVVDAVWEMRPVVGGEPASTLPSGRQFVRQDGDHPKLGRVAPIGFTFGTFTRNGLPDDDPARSGHLLVIEATMVDGLPVDVHAYAEDRAEFPNVSTGDQFFDDRDFEAYRMLGVTLAGAALRHDDGVVFRNLCLGSDPDDE